MSIKPSYHIIWKYKVPTEKQEQFMSVYGSGGSWARFFGESEYYKGSYLYRAVEKSDTFLLVDVWLDKAAYDAFREKHAERYTQLSESFVYLYDSEELLGGF